MPRHAITLVTAYFQLDNSGRGRSVRDYHGWIANLLPFVRWPLVIYCDAQSVEMLRRLRGGKPAVYRVMRLEDFSVYRYVDIIRANCAANWTELNPMVSLIYNEKANWMRRAIEQNDFGSEMFFWCDIGVFRSRKLEWLKLTERIEYPNLRVCRAAFGARVGLFGAPLPAPPPLHVSIRAGWWGGLAEPLRRYCDAYYDCLVRRIERGDFINNDELIAREIINYPSVDAYPYTLHDIRWFRWLKFIAPPPDVVMAYTLLSAGDFLRIISVKNCLHKLWRRLPGAR